MGGGFESVTELDLIVLISIEVNKSLEAMEQRICKHETIIKDRPWSYEVMCNLIFGHVAEEHTNGLSRWRDDD